MTGRKLKSTRVLIMGATIIVAAVMLLLVLNFYFLNVTKNSHTRIDKIHAQKLDIILKMTHIVRERSLRTLTMALEEDAWNVDEQFMKYHKLALQFIALRDQLKLLDLSQQEEKALNEALAYISTTEPMQNEIVERIHSGEHKNVRSDILEKDLPLEHKLLGIFDELANLVRHNAYEERIRAQSTYSRSIFIVIMVWIIITTIIIFFMYHSIKKVQDIEQDLIDETNSLNWNATHDPLTNIYNRRWLNHKIEQLYIDEVSNNNQHSLIYIDLDNFKPINDQYGHAAGDRYLVQFCRQVEKHIRQHDTFARIGGDEFVILLDSCQLEKARAIAESLIESIRQISIEHKGNFISSSCSIGLLEFSHARHTPEDLLHQADSLCYEAKRHGKNQISIRVLSGQ